MLKTASACLRYESIEDLQTLVGRIAEVEVLATTSRDGLERRRLDRAGTLAALELASDYLRDYRQMVTEFAAACAAEETEVVEEEEHPVWSGKVIPFPGRSINKQRRKSV